MTPPFFTASLSMAKAGGGAVSSRTSPGPSPRRMWATESPTAGVGASDRSTMPKGTSSRSRRLRSYQLAHAGDLERRALDEIAPVHSSVRSFVGLCQCRAHHARTG